MCGQEMDFDPDALVQNACYALCGPFGAVTQPAEPAALSDDDAMMVSINACDSLNITRVHEVGGMTLTIMEDGGLLELFRAIERAVRGQTCK